MDRKRYTTNRAEAIWPGPPLRLPSLMALSRLSCLNPMTYVAAGAAPSCLYLTVQITQNPCRVDWLWVWLRLKRPHAGVLGDQSPRPVGCGFATRTGGCLTAIGHSYAQVSIKHQILTRICMDASQLCPYAKLTNPNIYAWFLALTRMLRLVTWALSIRPIALFLEIRLIHAYIDRLTSPLADYLFP